MADKTDAEKAEKLKKFITATGADENVAKYYLESDKWNLETAISDFKYLKLTEERRLAGRATGGSDAARPRPTTASSSSERVGPLRRGLSMANSDLVANVRQQIQGCEISSSVEHLDFLDEKPTYSFILPNITVVQDKELVEFLKKDLIDKATYLSLTKAGVLNWWSEPNIKACRKLFPMSTIGDGNCLLHAVSLAMWGFHDRLLTLRKALYRFLTTNLAGTELKRRWMYQQWTLNMEAGGLTFTKTEWEDEWKGIVRLASDKPRGQNKTAATTRRISRQYSLATSSVRESPGTKSDSGGADSFESLEEFHVFALAHVIRRPIIVVSDTMLRDLEGQPLQPIHFGGIYLPIECSPDKCYKYPLVLGYDAGHFPALVPAEGEDVGSNKTMLSSSVPLTCPNMELLPLHFITDPGPLWSHTAEDSKRKKHPEMSKAEKLALLSKYMHVVKIGPENKPQSIIPSFQDNDVVETELDASDLGSFFKKKSKEEKVFVAKALETISTFVTAHTNLPKASPRAQRKPSNGNPLYASKLDLANRPPYFDDMVANYIANARKNLEQEKALNKNKSTRTKCISPGCAFYGNADSNYLCSKCFSYQQEVSRVHKSMPSLREEPTPLLKIAQRQLSNPENFKTDKTPEEPLIDFNDSTGLNRPGHLPPITDQERQFGTSKGFESTTDAPLPARNTVAPSAPLPSLDPYAPDVTQTENYHSTGEHNTAYQSCTKYPNIDRNEPANYENIPSAVRNITYRSAEQPQRLPPIQPPLYANQTKFPSFCQSEGYTSGRMSHAQTQQQQQNTKRQQQQNALEPNSSNASRLIPIGPAVTEFDPICKEDSSVTASQPVFTRPKSPTVMTYQNKFCKSNGCKFFGAQEFDGYCSSCFPRQYKQTGYV